MGNDGGCCAEGDPPGRPYIAYCKNVTNNIRPCICIIARMPPKWNVMTFDLDMHHRHSIRLKDYKYSQAGAYFVTLCAWQRECLFGEMVNGEMILNDMGRIIAEEWAKADTVRKNVVLDEFVVMPNHFHGIIVFTEPAVTVTYGGCCQNRATHRVAPTGSVSGSLGALLGQFKSIATKRINRCRNNPGCPVWQRNYYERVIRDDNELSRAREYIVSNPLKWELDKENPMHSP